MNKKLAFAALSLAVLAGAGQAQAADCPAGTKTVYSCKSTPKAGDNELASTMLDSVAVCYENAGTITQKVVMVSEKDGKQEQGYVSVSSRPGGVDYTDATNGDIDVTLSLPAGLSPTVKKVTGKFSLFFHGPKMSAASTYTCVRK